MDALLGVGLFFAGYIVGGIIAVVVVSCVVVGGGE